jgi:hypothetical protein
MLLFWAAKGRKVKRKIRTHPQLDRRTLARQEPLPKGVEFEYR